MAWDTVKVDGNTILPSDWNDMVTDQKSRAYNANIQTFTDGDTTPSVATYRTFKTANTASTTITTFDSGVDGQEIIILFNDSNTIIQNGTNIKLQGAGNFTGAQYDTLTLVRFSSTPVWVELSRSVNS